MKPAVFLDRDGVINVDRDFVHRIDDFKFVEGIFALVAFLKENGFLVVVVTNQSGIGRGYYSLDDFHRLNRWMMNEFSARGVDLDGVYFCPHAPEEGCECRKPRPGMILQALADWSIDLSRSWIIGDKERDLEAGAEAGVPNRIFFEMRYRWQENSTATHVARSMAEIREIIAAGLRSSVDD